PVMSGCTPGITRVYVSSLTPRATALLRNWAIHCSKPISARAADSGDSAAAPPARPASRFRRVRFGSVDVAIRILSYRRCYAAVRARLLMRRLDLIRRAQFCDQGVKTVGETVDAEVERIVMTIGDLRIDRGVKRRNEPVFGADAGDDVE